MTSMRHPLVHALAILPAMRRWLVIALLVLVPLQLSWAAVGAYCGHETDSRGAAHLGHHAHEHHAHSADADADAAQAPDQAHAPPSLGQFDQDCGTCHLGMAALPVPATALPALAHSEALIQGRVPHYRSADPRRLERPNWLAPAL